MNTTVIIDKSSEYVKITAIISLMIICVTALSHGINSSLTATISAIIGGIAGYEIGKRKR